MKIPKDYQDEIQIVDIEENEDGSANLEMTMDAQTYASIFEYGFKQLVMKMLEEEKQNEIRSDD